MFGVDLTVVFALFATSCSINEILASLFEIIFVLCFGALVDFCSG